MRTFDVPDNVLVDFCRLLLCVLTYVETARSDLREAFAAARLGLSALEEPDEIVLPYMRAQALSDLLSQLQSIAFSITRGIEPWRNGR